MKTLNEEQRRKLEDMAYHIRKRSLEMIAVAGWGHIGGSFSIAEVLSVLYFHVMRVQPDNPGWEDRDYFVLSKAHSSPALYAALGLRGYYPIEEIYNYCRLGGLDGHTDMLETPGIEYTGGSLGTGLSYSVGLALGLKMKERYHQRVFCLVGDGESNEGQIWEAAMSAAQFRLDNLIAIVDYNKVMAKGFIYNMMGLEPFAEKWKSFGWEVIQADGHDVDELARAFHQAKYLCVVGKPVCIVAHTVKGKGIAECEFNYHWHTHAPSKKKADIFLKELAGYYGRSESGFDRVPDSAADGEMMEVTGGELE